MGRQCTITGRLFLPLNFMVGWKPTEHTVISAEFGIPIIRDFPVYTFKTQLRVGYLFKSAQEPVRRPKLVSSSSADRIDKSLEVSRLSVAAIVSNKAGLRRAFGFVRYDFYNAQSCSGPLRTTAHFTCRGLSPDAPLPEVALSDLVRVGPRSADCLPVLEGARLAGFIRVMMHGRGAVYRQDIRPADRVLSAIGLTPLKNRLALTV